jgi:hypothetical protein
MRIVLIILFVLASIHGRSQNYVVYYQQLNEAKLLAVNGEFEASSQLFQITFQDFEFRFARDCVHAVETASRTTDTTLLDYFIQCGLKQGIPIQFFKEKNDLEWFRHTENWVEVLMNTDSLNQVYKGSFNSELREELNQMFTEDQEIRERFYRWYNFLGRPFIGRKWRKLNEKQVERIVDIIREYGFPGEQLIGIDFPADHPKISATQFSAGIPIVLLVHHYGKSNQSYGEILFDQLKLGYLYNEHFATICDFEAEFGRKKHEKFGFHGLRFGQRGRKENTYDAKRQEIGLMTYLEYKKLNQSSVYTKFWNRLK